jgi:hypothetical protein
MVLLPKEHGAYGQLAFPLVIALACAGSSIGGLLFTVAVVAAFLAHEPAAVLLGSRGPRARRELGARASRWLLACLAVMAIAGAAALLVMDPPARWSTLLPLAPAGLLALATLRGGEKSAFGEVATAVALSAAAVPVSLAAGAPLEAAAGVAIPFGLLFASSTLAVRVVILRVRGGGDRAAAAATRSAALALVAAGAVTLALLAGGGVLPVSVLVAAAPGLLTATFVACRPPAPIHLRRVGWTLVAVSVATSVIVVAQAA